MLYALTTRSDLHMRQHPSTYMKQTDSMLQLHLQINIHALLMPCVKNGLNKLY